MPLDQRASEGIRYQTITLISLFDPIKQDARKIDQSDKICDTVTRVIKEVKRFEKVPKCRSAAKPTLSPCTADYSKLPDSFQKIAATQQTSTGTALAYKAATADQNGAKTEEVASLQK
jgi:hypothetical protein